MRELHISLLRPLQVTFVGHRLDSFRTRKVQALLIYLLVETMDKANFKLSREQIMTLLWPDMPEKSARANLRQTLYQLRKIIPEVSDSDGQSVPFILSDRQHIWVNPPASYHLDVATFISLIEQGGNEQLAQAVELYAGDFLADFYLEDSSQFESWAVRWRRYLRSDVLSALDQLASYHLENGHMQRAVQYARRQLEIDNLRESAYRHVIIALSRMGRRSEALRMYEDCCRRLEQELHMTPSAETEAVMHAVREESGTATPLTVAEQPARSRLPVPDTPLVGRDKELDELIALLGDKVRLISVVGPGGMGKTRLALEAAHQENVVGSKVFVNLVSAANMGDMVTLIGRRLGVESDQADQKDLKRRLLDYLKNKALLLVLDNFEHLLETTPFLREVLQTAPAVQLMVTSRERLKLQAEYVFPLSGLSYSGWITMVEAQQNVAVQLFLHHMQRVHPSFVLRDEHLPAIHNILRLTEGMPLALILAAGWGHVLEPAEIADEIDKSMDFLEATQRDLPPRQQSMRAVFDATWGRLNKPEQEMFAALTVFQGGFTLEAARIVVNASLHELMRLVDQSLLTRLHSGRFEIHEILRQFAAERLETRGMAKTIRAAHSDYYLEVLANHLPGLKGSEQLEALSVIEIAFDNVRAAWSWACEHKQLPQMVEAAQSLYLFCLIRSRYLDGIELFQIACRASSNRNRHKASYTYLLASWKSLLGYAGSHEEALTSSDELESFRATEVGAAAVAYAQMTLGQLLAQNGHLSQAKEMLECAFAYFQEVDEPFYAATAANNLSVILMQDGKPEDALALMHQGLALARQQGERYTAGALLFNVGAITWEREGPTDECERYYWEAAKLRRELGEQVSYANILSQVANIPLWRDGDVSTPLPALAEALAIAEEQDVPGTRAHVLAEMTTHRLVAGDYQEALALTDEVLSLTSSHRGTWTWASMQHGIALVALGDIEAGLSYMKRSLTRMVEKHWKSFIGIFLPFLGIVLARRGEYEQAVELLALGFAQRYTGRLDIDPLITQLRFDLKVAVGEEQFAAIWARSQGLDVLSVANEILGKLNS